jgi:hypothetical protein
MQRSINNIGAQYKQKKERLMKKLMALLLVLVGLAASEASAGYRHCYGRRCRTRCAEPLRVTEVASRPCKVDLVQEEACPEAPCCVKYVKVEEPALITKHISYSAECPSGCTPAEQKAGMMHAGETINY